MTRRLALPLAAAVIAACAGPRLKVGQVPGGEVIEVVGEAVMVPKDPEGTKKRSLLDAQKKAVEMVVGVHISGKTRVENAVAIDSNILARTEGYVKKYDVLKEGEELGMYKTKIRALVMTDKVAEDLKALGLLSRPEVGHPRVAVLLTETADGVGEDFEAVSSGHAMVQALLDQGYKVVDRTDLLAANAEKVAQALAKGDASGVPDLGRRLDAEVLIFGNAYGHRIESEMLGELYSYRVTLNAQVYKAQTNEILLTVGKVASGLDASKTAAASKALGNAGKLAGEEVASKLARELARRASVILTLSGVSDLSRLQEFQKALDAMPGVGDYYLRSFEKGRATVEVQMKSTSSQELADGIEESRWARAKVAAVTRDTVEVELKP